MREKNKWYRSDIPVGAKERKVSSYNKGDGSIWLRVMDCLYRGNIVGKRYYEKDGTLVIEEPLKNGLRHGVVYHWDEKGKLVSAEPYFKGKPHGIAKQFDYDGTLLGIYKLTYGTGFDVWRQKDEKGKIYVSEIHSMKNGLPHGFEWWLCEDQKSIHEECHWHKGMLHGIKRIWNMQRKLQRGYPKYYILGKRVTKREYIITTNKDPTLPKFRDEDQMPIREYPNGIKNILKKT